MYIYIFNFHINYGFNGLISKCYWIILLATIKYFLSFKNIEFEVVIKVKRHIIKLMLCSVLSVVLFSNLSVN